MLNPLLWNSLYCSDKKYPYLKYDIIIECKNLNPVKLTKKQINLYKKICKLRNRALTFKQISNELNMLEYKPIRGKVGEFTPQKVWSNFTKIKKNQDRKVEITLLDVKNIRLVWE